MLTKGTYVKTPLGFGTVAFQRMRGPDYREPEAVSVILEARASIEGYRGTMFRAQDVVVFPRVGSHRKD